ncbi:probable pseudouridine-5'-phosphatase isoform X2 [Lutzomyia longipalpis]|uniref:probable pseudouridine-5'-phosphatase isoform X2 n=1 Tax=Lutzomyia longipalpis TaxID=7200 RepID=UPI002483563F|nr:probable pseudouridine-5'-phosphatase isoform X2 [Lutzomyia longipalpis]
MNRLVSTGRGAVQSAKMGFRKVTHVIFDMDGLLLDTEGIYEGTVRDILRSFSKTYTRELRYKVLGTTEQKTVEIIINDLNLPITHAEFHRKFLDISNQRLVNAPFLRGAEKLVRHLHDNKIPIALATSSSKESTDVKTAQHKALFDLFHHKVMGSSDADVKNGKPAPDIFLVAASRFPDNPSPENCLVFEDAPNGVKAARSAGMQVVMVPDEHIGEDQKKEATVVLKSLEDVKLEDFGLPPLHA